MESRNLVQTATSEQDIGTFCMCPTLASSWWGPSPQYRQWNVSILGIISLNRLGDQVLLGLPSSRVDTTVVKQPAGKCLSQQVFGTGGIWQVWDTYGWTCPGMERRTPEAPSKAYVQEVNLSREHALCWSHNQDHFQELGVTWFWTKWELQPSIFPEAYSFFHY